MVGRSRRKNIINNISKCSRGNVPSCDFAVSLTPLSTPLSPNSAMSFRIIRLFSERIPEHK
jgi:hypothetical protein